MERRNGRDLALSVRMGVALVLLGLLYLPLPIWLVLMTAGVTGSWPLAIGTLAGAIVFVCYLPSLSERVALASALAPVVDPDDEPELHTLVSRLAGMADVQVPRIAIAQTDVPNAFAAGRSPTNAVLVVTRGLLRRLPEAELEAVLAHELTHIGNRDAFVMTLVAAPAMLGHRIFTWIVGAPRRAQGPVKALVFFALLYCFFVLFLFWVLYALATGLVMTISRYREYVADRGAVLLTGTPEELMSALQRLAAELPLIPKSDLRDVAGVSSLFILPVEGSSDWFELDPRRIFRSHPPLESRLARLSQAGRELGRSARSEDPAPPHDRAKARSNPRALVAFFCAAVYWCFVATLWLGSGDPFEVAWPMALAWIGGVVLALQGAGRASDGASGMHFAVGALALLVGPWVLAIVVFFVVMAVGATGVVG
jgi:heat shock protein HtpX